MKQLLLISLAIGMAANSLDAQDWQTDFEKAKTMASQENKTIILVFKGSDWCASCIKLDREIWRTDTFKNYAKDNFVMVLADFPRKKENALSVAQTAANAQLAETYNKKGIFPLVVVMDAEGVVLGETTYQKVSPEEYIHLLTAFIE